ncbi:unnamed protein product [Clonostachys chloroleuca]|uniref:Uncharacterized protein n=1 Tax=Clonostachys chloroleuca TaxID=1926264 RepID=A0AA35LWH3_9HYPO|nr:unnamed protein product [Clonostachys chloroleuca]
MNDTLQSPKRRHILSSINPDEDDDRPKKSSRRRRSRSRSPKPHRDHKESKEEQDGDPNAPRRSRLRLKDHKSSRRRRSRSRDSRRHHHHESSSSSHRHHRRHRDLPRSPTPPNPFEPEPLDREAAFRESLFDAMADDEGALYWEGVYGQPVHVYSNERVGPQGELERMSDEEYAAYVRQKMWEKTHAGLMEERARREEARKNKEKEEAHQRKLKEQMDESLRRGEERRQRKEWVRRWEEYNEAWARWDEGPTASSLPWPSKSGDQSSIDEKTVKGFLINCLKHEDKGEKGFLTKLKEERVRWHPDKIQQKLGGQVAEDTMRKVTAIFQIIDRLWSDMRDGK